MSHRVNPGDKSIPAAALNRAFAASDKVLGGLGERPGSLASGIVLVQNNSGADIDRNGILGIDGVVIDHSTNSREFLNRIILDGNTPAKADHWGSFVVCLEPILDGKIGRAVAEGLVQTQIDVKNAGHRFADVLDADAAKLLSVGCGSARIAWKESGTGTKWALVQVAARHTLTCPIEITGNAEVNAGRFRYAWREVILDGSAGTHSTVTGGLSGTNAASQCAYSLLELGSTGTDEIAGVDLDGTDYPGGFAPRPIGGGGTSNTHKVDTVVQAEYIDGRMWITGPNLTHDGTCAAP